MTDNTRIDRDANPVKKSDVLDIYTDGASRNNPGKGSGAFIFVLKDDIICSDAQYFGDITNNQAEYKALIMALDRVIEFTRWHIRIHSDSELLIKQMSGDWRVKEPMLKELYREAGELEKGIQKIEYLHVPRSNRFIKIVDKMCNECLDKNLK
ncbi:MAG: ribonuclease HI family protein [candidate division Zixibacteria bacterium]|nr:ribonuclease HI family protein [candidate division Zixibacteria bacterium]